MSTCQSLKYRPEVRHSTRKLFFSLMYSTCCPSSSKSYSVLVSWSGGVSWVYLRDLCCHTPDTRGRSSLRSLEQGLLFVSFARTSTTQARAFSLVGPSVYNGLLLAQRLLSRILSDTLYSCLKTVLFSVHGPGALLSSNLEGVLYERMNE